MGDMVPNRPTPEGEALGAQLARLTESALAKLKLDFPKHMEPCVTCAFRRGTLPNRCLSTTMDALKCVMEGVDFMCHHTPKNEHGNHTGFCTGYMIARAAVFDSPTLECPWPFSHEDDDNTAPSGEEAA